MWWGRTVVVEGVSDVLLQVVDGALVGLSSLDPESCNCTRTVSQQPCLTLVLHPQVALLHMQVARLQARHCMLFHNNQVIAEGSPSCASIAKRAFRTSF